MTYIEEYYQYLLDNPDKACNKVLIVYKKLVNDIKKPKQVSFFNKITEENETYQIHRKRCSAHMRGHIRGATGPVREEHYVIRG